MKVKNVDEIADYIIITAKYRHSDDQGFRYVRLLQSDTCFCQLRLVQDEGTTQTRSF